MNRLLGGGLVMMVVAIGCFVDRRASEFTCRTDADCDDFDDDRTCTEGHCTLLVCPAICDGGCGPGKTCEIVCSNGNECRNGVACPAGFTCTFTCEQDCGPIACPLGCDVACAGAAAECGPITCGAGATCTCAGDGDCL